MPARALQPESVRFQKEIWTSRRPWQLPPRQFAHVQRGGAPPHPRVFFLLPQRESSLQFPPECELRVPRARGPRLRCDRAHLVLLASALALPRAVADLLWPSATPQPRPDGVPLPRRDAVPLLLPSGVPLRQRCVALLLRPGGELLPRPGAALRLPRGDAQPPLHVVALQSLRAVELRLPRGGGLVLLPGVGLTLRRGGAGLPQRAVAHPVQLSGERVRVLAPVRFPLRRREILFPH